MRFFFYIYTVSDTPLNRLRSVTHSSCLIPISSPLGFSFPFLLFFLCHSLTLFVPLPSLIPPPLSPSSQPVLVLIAHLVLLYSWYFVADAWPFRCLMRKISVTPVSHIPTKPITNKFMYTNRPLYNGDWWIPAAIGGSQLPLIGIYLLLGPVHPKDGCALCQILSNYSMFTTFKIP